MIARLRHPGPAIEPRWTALPCTATPVAVTLPVRESLIESVAAAMTDVDGAWLWIEGAEMARLDFVIPGRDDSGRHAAWYAGPHRMGPGARLVRLGLHLGWREGVRFVHGHGVFAGAGRAGPDAGPAAGHILPQETALAAPARATGFAIRGARLVQHPDPETGFPLFAPEPCGGGEGALLMTARPNQDLGQAVAAAAAAHGIAQGAVHGLGSLVAPCFADGRRLDSFATEILLTAGRIARGTVSLSADVVGFDGVLQHGALRPGRNGVCVTAELLVTRADTAAQGAAEREDFRRG